MTQTTCPRCCGSISEPGRCGACGFGVPAEWFTEVPLSIAMSGARTAGKSVLIAVMMQQFRYFLEQKHKTFLEPLGDTQQRFHTKYIEPLYHHRNMLPPTASAALEPIVPLMWSFRYGGRRYCLALYDAAGEDFELGSPNNPAFAYLAHVDLIVSLVDPLKVEGISAVLDGTVTIPSDSGNDLTVMRQVIGARKAHLTGPPKFQALAIVISKFDVLQRLRKMPAMPWQSIMNRPGAAMLRDPSFVALEEDKEEGDRLQAEIESLLHLMNAELLLAAASEAGLPYRLFAVSALGQAPSSDAVHRGGISPYRVIELVKAALSLKAEVA